MALFGAMVAASLVVGRADAQSFQLLGVPQGTVFSRAFGVSYDGGVVAGASWPQGTPLPVPQYGPGWSWSATGGRQDLIGPSLPFNTSAYGISGNGNVLIGEASDGLANTPAIAYRYDRTTGEMTSLGVQSGGDRSRALGANLDGSVVVGYSSLDSTLSFTQAFRWTTAGGLQPLGYARPGDFYSQSLAVSANGETVIGFSGAGTTAAFRWTSTTGMTVLPTIAGAPVGSYYAHGLNRDASILVGVLGPNSGLVRGVMWRDGVAIDLGTNGYAGTFATDVDDSGNVVVGQVRVGNSYFAGIWTPVRQFEPLSTYLASIGVTLPDGVLLRDATSISRDGRTISGYTAINPDGTVQAWVATIPAPATLVLFVLAPAIRRRTRGIGYW